MVTIQAVYNILDKNWAVSINTVFQRINHLTISFIAGEESETVKFDNLQFGYDLKLGDEIILRNHFPKQGQKYISSDSSPLVTEVLYFDPNKTYELCFFAENLNHRTEKTIEIIVPLPDKPHNSWTWNEEVMEWLAPIPQPKNIPHDWDEATLSWIQRSMPM